VIGVVLLFLGVRLVYPLLFAPPSNFVDAEDLVRGTLAHDLIHGLKVPFWEYLADYYSGGSVVVGPMAVPFFLLFGSTLFALRLVAILFSLAVLLVWYAFVARNFDRRAALVTALFFVLPPPVYLEWSSRTMGFHTESMLFSGLAFLLLFEMLRRDDGRMRWPLALGLTLGFGSWFCYTTLVSVAIVLAWWWWHDHRFAGRRSFALFLLSFALGIAPWIPANLSQHFRGLEFLSDGLRYQYVRGLPETGWRIVKTTLWCVPTMFVQNPFQRSGPLAWPAVYATLFGGALLWLVVRDWHRARLGASPPAGWFFVFGSVVYVLVVSATRYPLHPYGSMYLAPMLLLFYGAAGVLLSRLEGNGGWSRAVAMAVVAVAMIGGGLGLWNLLDFRWPGASFTLPGYSYAQLAQAIDTRHPSDQAHFTSLLPRVERTMTASERSDFVRPWLPNGYRVKRDDVEAEARRFAEFAEPARAIGYFQLGIMLHSVLHLADDPLVARLSQEYPWIAEGLRFSRVGPHLGLDDYPVVDRLPLSLDGDTRLFFFDTSTHRSPDEVGWVKGEEEATFLIESSWGIPPLVIRLTNGDRPNSATLASAQGVKTVRLAPGQSVAEALELGPGISVEGKSYAKLSVASRYGHFPILTRRDRDTRYLGVHVTIACQRAAPPYDPRTQHHSPAMRAALIAPRDRDPHDRDHTQTEL
jgi:4-amino-4-deoxy-L-arabinose transferase-like glycosyltransferase